MNALLSIFIIGTAIIAGCGAGWWLRGSGLIPGSLPDLGRDEADRLRKQLEQAQATLADAAEQAEQAQAQVAESAKQAAMAADRSAHDQRELARALKERDEARDEADEAHQALTQLQELVARMSADVDEHNVRVQEIRDEISGATDSAVVVDAVARLIEANAQMQARLHTAEERLREQERALEAQMAEARTDALTRLANRRAFDLRMQELERAFREQQRPSCVMMVDVDHFKKFNDTHGHQAGDEVLRNVARVLTQAVSSNALVCRYGGEEFAIIFGGCDLETARPAAERARAAIADGIVRFEGTELRVTASGGVAGFLPNEATEALVKRADDALYACKQAGRNCGHWHDGEKCHSMTKTSSAETATTDSADRAAAAEKPAAQPSNRDPVTGLSARGPFLEDVERRLAEWRRGGPDVSLILVEIDRFEKLIKAFGEAAGDTMLRATAQLLKVMMRDMDHVARFDSRQFALMLPGAATQDAEAVAERLRAAIENCKLPVKGGLLQFTISTGVTQMIQNDTVDTLLDRACSLIHGEPTVTSPADPVEATL